MVTALGFGVAASSSLVVGALLGAYWKPREEWTAVALAFASGALVTALAYDLFEHAVREAGLWTAAAGLLAVSVVVGNRLFDTFGEHTARARAHVCRGRGGGVARHRVDARGVQGGRNLRRRRHRRGLSPHVRAQATLAVRRRAVGRAGPDPPPLL